MENNFSILMLLYAAKYDEEYDMILEAMDNKLYTIQTYGLE